MTRITISNAKGADGPFEGRTKFLPGQIPMCEKLHELLSGSAGLGRDTIPWITAVVGSGCLQTVPQTPITPEILKRSALATLASLPASDLPAVPTGSEHWSKIIGSFTESLARGRCTPADPSVPSSGMTELALSADSVRLLLVAALLTRLAHAGRAAGPTALGRSADEVVRIDDVTSLDDPLYLRATVIEPVRSLLHTLSGTLPRTELADESNEEALLFQAFATVCARVLDDLAKGELSLNSVRILTEASWYALTRSVQNYYGWTEVLIGLLVKSNGAGHRRRRPRLTNLIKSVEWIEQLFKEPTLQRRQQLETGEIDTTSMYAAVARTLIAQSQFLELQRSQDDYSDPWPPVAISMGFDLELEMHLLQLQQPFTIAMPIHQMFSNAAETNWMAAHIDPAGGDHSPWSIEHPHKLRPVKWTTLDQLQVRNDDPVRPLILRMAGAPLVDVSLAFTLDKQPGGAPPSPIEARRTVAKPHPCVPVDEYHAMRVGQSELGLSAPPRSSDKGGQPREGIPTELLADDVKIGGSQKASRYWCLLGVPLTDPAVRQRFMSLMALRAGFTQVFIADNTGSSGEEAPDSSAMRGLAVNRQVDDDETWFLSWMGFDVVRSPLGAFVKDLGHCAEHLDRDASFNANCELR